MDKYIGKLLDSRYQIQQLIGLGGMANVYKAFDKKQERFVAIKILKDEYVDNEDFLRRFKNESKAIAALSHENIVNIFDMSFGDGFYWIAMEYVDGITLKDYIEQQGVLNTKEAIHFVLQILLALQHAHNKGIIHRDIKPQNIMLLRDGTIKIMDFGIARFARNETRTLTDKAIGSVHYISPEQAKGEIIDQTTDIYSVGVILFEMLTGALPFEADSAVSVAIKQIEAQAIRPRQINSQIPRALEQIIIKAMMKNKKDRYQSTTQMIKDIVNFKNNPSIVLGYQSPKNKIEKTNKSKLYN
ncbi:MAG: serine/threonine protein kinase, partial [Oscillospiraceae bacterium]|nr:serine/threonine protein kinase [Oscillospiraceae bacterium]